MGRERKRRVNKRTKVKKNGKEETKKDVTKRESWRTVEGEMRKKIVGEKEKKWESVRQ